MHRSVATLYCLAPYARTLQVADHAGNELLVVRSTSIYDVWVALGCVITRALRKQPTPEQLTEIDQLSQ